jgi:hypothetical protein
MSFGERAALEGVLAQLNPRLAIEIGRAEGGTLRRIAAHSEEVHSIDPLEPVDDSLDLVNTHLHVGYSYELLPDLLTSLAEQGRNVDFALVDGDHSTDGVRRDIEMLLLSPAISKTVILAHDTSQEDVRAGFSAVSWEEHPKIVHVDIDFLPGYIFASGHFRNELWGGFGLILADAERPVPTDQPVHQDRYHDVLSLLQLLSKALRQSRDTDLPRPGEHTPEVAVSMLDNVERSRREAERRVRDAEQGRMDAESRVADAESRAAEAEELTRSIVESRSWRLTAPLREAKRQLESWRARRDEGR